eukprot:INCI7062.1.p1 GENE.INCI7062.1~~INCI7062.1.p1  ORF type:complete len:951 (-),score=205.02 INCI7062.1:1229-4081(-)
MDGGKSDKSGNRGTGAAEINGIEATEEQETSSSSTTTTQPTAEAELKDGDTQATGESEAKDSSTQASDDTSNIQVTEESGMIGNDPLDPLSGDEEGSVPLPLCVSQRKDRLQAWVTQSRAMLGVAASRAAKGLSAGSSFKGDDSAGAIAEGTETGAQSPLAQVLAELAEWIEIDYPAKLHELRHDLQDAVDDLRRSKEGRAMDVETLCEQVEDLETALSEVHDQAMNLQERLENIEQTTKERAALIQQANNQLKATQSMSSPPAPFTAGALAAAAEAKKKRPTKLWKRISPRGGKTNDDAKNGDEPAMTSLDDLLAQVELQNLKHEALTAMGSPGGGVGRTGSSPGTPMSPGTAVQKIVGERINTLLDKNPNMKKATDDVRTFFNTFSSKVKAATTGGLKHVRRAAGDSKTQFERVKQQLQKGTSGTSSTTTATVEETAASTALPQTGRPLSDVTPPGGTTRRASPRGGQSRPIPPPPPPGGEGHSKGSQQLARTSNSTSRENGVRKGEEDEWFDAEEQAALNASNETAAEDGLDHDDDTDDDSICTPVCRDELNALLRGTDNDLAVYMYLERARKQRMKLHRVRDGQQAGNQPSDATLADARAKEQLNETAAPSSSSELPSENASPNETQVVDNGACDCDATENKEAGLEEKVGDDHDPVGIADSILPEAQLVTGTEEDKRQSGSVALPVEECGAGEVQAHTSEDPLLFPESLTVDSPIVVAVQNGRLEACRYIASQFYSSEGGKGMAALAGPIAISAPIGPDGLTAADDERALRQAAATPRVECLHSEGKDQLGQVTLLHLAVLLPENQLDMLRWLARAVWGGYADGHDLCGASLRGGTPPPALFACCAGNLPAVKLLVNDHGADVSINTTSAGSMCFSRGASSALDNGWTAAHFAAAAGHTQVLRWLAEHGHIVGAIDANGCTPLDVALAAGFNDAADFLCSLDSSP